MINEDLPSLPTLWVYVVFWDTHICVHSDHRAGAGVDIVTEYEVQLGSLQIQMKFYLEKMKLR